MINQKRFRCSQCGKRSNFMELSFISRGHLRTVLYCPKCISIPIDKSLFDDKKGALWSIFLLLAVIVIIVVGSVLYITSRPAPALANISQNISYFTVYIGSNAVSKVSYRLVTNETLITGQLFPNAIEEYSHVAANSYMNLSAWSPEYYFNQTTCNITQNQSKCIVGMDLKAKDFVVLLSNTTVAVSNVSGLVQNPLICWSWKENIVNVLMELPSVKVPNGYIAILDACFQSPNIRYNTGYSYSIHFNPSFKSLDYLTAYVIDSEVIGHDPIGFRNNSINFIN